MFFALLHASVTWEIDNSVRDLGNGKCLRVAALVWQSLPRACQAENLFCWEVEARLLTKVDGRRRGDRGHEKELEWRLKGEADLKGDEGFVGQTLRSLLLEVFKFWTWLESLACELGGWCCFLGCPEQSVRSFQTSVVLWVSAWKEVL